MEEIQPRAASKAQRYWQLIAAMVRTGVLGYGGGPSVIPLIQHEAVNRYQWIDEEEFGDVLALAKALPGPIATKMAGQLGYRLLGYPGAAVAIIAHILPSSVAMITLMSIVQVLSHSRIIQGMIQGVAPVIAVMIGMIAYDFTERVFSGLGKWFAIFTLVLCFVLMQIFSLHPAILIVVFLLYGSVHYSWMDKLRKHRGKEPSEEHQER
ncbi:chromate transporter [Paenibacillus sp. 1001270B_150601_E10]|uniref:chromate transporter n=1 Tax=Paenibacillus sp. 1001270B_150601_E10 TaxID=2787079 RepID=UPI0018A00203|nr:chromate transporter [Paenibacillus sp. 1001270B_150601_E10]